MPRTISQVKSVVGGWVSLTYTRILKTITWASHHRRPANVAIQPCLSNSMEDTQASAMAQPIKETQRTDTSPPRSSTSFSNDPSVTAGQRHEHPRDSRGRGDRGKRGTGRMQRGKRSIHNSRASKRPVASSEGYVSTIYAKASKHCTATDVRRLAKAPRTIVSSRKING